MFLAPDRNASSSLDRLVLHVVAPLLTSSTTGLMEAFVTPLRLIYIYRRQIDLRKSSFSLDIW